MSESAADKASREFVEWWFGKRPNESLEDAIYRYVMQPHGAWQTLKRLIDSNRINHDPGDEDRA